MAGAMVISEWNVGNQPNASGEYIGIRGRAPGLLSWLLSVLGVERGIRMVATSKHIKFTQGDLGGSSTRIIPFDKICSTSYGYKKPWIEALTIIWVAGAMLYSLGTAMIGGVMGGIIGVLIAIGIAALYYTLNKRMSISLIEMSGTVNQIVFKRSVLEGIQLDETTSAYASDIIQWLMDQAGGGSGSAPTNTIQQGHI